MLYELLADTRPPRSTAAGGANAAAEPPPPSAAIDRSTGNARRRALRGDLDRIVLTALAHEPRRRYPSAEALAADIRRYLSGRPVLARGDSAWYRFRKYARRNRYALAAALIAFGVCLAAAIVSLHQAQLARAQALRAEQQTAQADAARTFLVGVFEHADPDENKGQSITAQQLLERGEQQLRAIDDSQPAIRADLTTLISGLYWDIGNSEHAAKLLPLLQAAATDPRVPDLIRSKALSGLARAEIDQRLFDQAIPHAELALELAGNAGKSGEREASEASHQLAHALSELNDPRAEPLLRQVMASDLATHGERSEEVADDLLLLGFTLDALLRPDEAVATFQRQLALARDLHGDLHSSVVNGLNGLAGALMRKGDWEAAESTYRQSLDAERRLLGPDHVSTQIIHSNLLAMMERRGNFADALPERLQMLRKGKNVPDAMRDHSVALVTHLIGVDYRELGQWDNALAAARGALAIWHRTQAADDAIDSAPPLENLGVTLYLQGRYVDAEDALQHAIAIMQKRAAPTSQWLARMRGELADTWRRQHRYADALREVSTAMAVLAPALKASLEANAVAGVLQAQVSEAQLDSGDAASADKSADEALTRSRHALPKGNYRLGIALFASARAKLALGRPGEAESLLREALVVRSPPHPVDDPRVLEVKVALINALDAQGKRDEARALTAEVGPRLKASSSPYATDLLARLAQH